MRVLPDGVGLQGRKSHTVFTEPYSSKCGLPTLIRGAEDAPQGPRIALPGWPLRQPNDATTRACGRHARSVGGGPRRAVHIVPAPWARQLSSSVAEEMCLPSFRRWPDQVCDALERIALPPWLLSGRRGTGALDLIARPASLRQLGLDLITRPPSLRSPFGRRGTTALSPLVQNLIARPPSLRRGTRGDPTG